ncbi:MAG: GTPase ObgE [Chthoniobacterales bacterium]|jgi:GTP-binding protein|nr:GTPase ObgE [Chthoniobacterales bacterium]
MFVDQIRISAKAGDGGNGCSSFRREKFVPRGGPDGGDGGDGGSVILRADSQVDTLVTLYYEPMVRAKNGGNGLGKQKYGRSAPDKIVPVPVGTLVYRLPDVAPHNPLDVRSEDDPAPVRRKIDPKELDLLCDLDADGSEFLLGQGGRGGKGNIHFKSSRNRAPRQFTEGTPGEEGWFFLELRMIADAGLVGYPNAGKSTLLGALSAAHPKVAAYPFTTLHPMVGVMDFPGFRRAAVADIPGLIEGAHLDVGLGHDFLRHIVRCRTLLLVVDAAGSEGRDPVEDAKKIREELSLYDPLLARRPWALVANKTDLPGAAENLPHLAQEFPGIPLIAISAQKQDGLEELRKFLDVEIGRPG